MDTMYRKKARELEEQLSEQKNQNKKKHVSDSFRPKVRPRETHPDPVDAQQRISENLNQLNRRLVEHPAGALARGKQKAQEVAAVGEDRGDKVVTRAAGIKAPAPLAIIFSCALIAVVFMYMLTLYVQIEEYSHSIDVMESEIAELKDEATQLEVQLENKYDLDEVERIATQEYGMVAASSLPKKYISVTQEKDVWQETETEKENSFWDSVFEKNGKSGE